MLAGRTENATGPPDGVGEGQRRKSQRARLGGAGDGGARWPGVEARSVKVPFFSVPEGQAPNTQSLGPVKGRGMKG